MSASFVLRTSVREPVTALLVGLICSLLIVRIATVVAQTRDAPPACATPEHRQFDFWIGDWQLKWQGSEGNQQRGTNRITARYDDCVIHEDFQALAPNGLRGMSVSTYDAQTATWRQTWVDNQGGYLEFAGGFKDGAMILSRTGPRDGEQTTWRMVWSSITENSLDWKYEASTDGGSTWEILWSIRYERKNGGASDSSPNPATLDQRLIRAA
jgi:hypothetical protein